MKLRNLVEKAHAASRAKGWYDGADANRNIGDMLMLIVTEVAEAKEDERMQPRSELARLDLRDENGKPIGFASEIADIVIRVGDLCGYLGIDLEEAVAIKMAYNATRSHRHGGKRS